jgi:hypothetical protein
MMLSLPCEIASLVVEHTMSNLDKHVARRSRRIGNTGILDGIAVYMDLVSW